MDVAKVNTVESELDGLICRRHETRVSEEQGRVEDGWAESVRCHHAQRREALAWQWLEYHQRRRRAHRKTFALLDAHHEAEIQRYSEMLGIDDKGDDAA